MSEPIRIRDAYPGDKKLNGYLGNLKKYINDGLNNKSVEAACITAGLIELRHILEHILKQYWIKIGKGSVKADPCEKINVLRSQGILNENQADFLHEVRMAVNDRVHDKNYKNRKEVTMPELVRMGNGLSDFIVNKFKKDVPTRLTGGRKRSSKSRVKRIEPYRPEVPSMAQVQQFKGQEKKATLYRPESLPKTNMQQIEMQKEKMKSYKTRHCNVIGDIYFYPQACLEEHIISAQEYERVLPTFSLDGLMHPEIWENNARLRKLHEKVVWEGAKITSLMFAEKKRKKRGTLDKWEKEEISVSEKSRKKEVEYQKHGVPFLKIMLDSLYPHKFGAPWIMLYCKGVDDRISLRDFGCRRWLFQADIPEKRKEKIKRSHKAALLFATAIDSILLLLVAAVFLWSLYSTWNSTWINSDEDRIVMMIGTCGFSVVILSYPAVELVFRISDWWNAFKKACK